jgi:hypothetical protein
MSLTTKGKTKGEAPPSAVEIPARIEQLKAEVRRLEREQYRLAALSVDDPKIEEEYQRCIADSVGAQKEISRLEAALIGLDRRDRAAAASDLAGTRRAQLAEFETCAKQRQAALDELARSIEQATAAYAKFLAAAAQMERSLPIGATLSMSPHRLEVVAGGPPVPCALATAVAAEFYRVAGGARLALPGAHAPNLQTTDRPGDIEPLAATSARLTQAIIADIRGQVERAEKAEAAKLEAA